MSLTKYLIDSDVARCMCSYELIEDLATALGVTLADFFVLSQLKYQLHLAKPAKALKKLGTSQAVQQAQRLVDQASEVVVMADSANYVLLDGTPDIDGGELALFAALCESPSTGLVTGDKRALVALCKVTGAIESAFTWAQILCLEEAIACLIAHFGLDHVSNKVRAHVGTNIALEMIFGRSRAATIEDVNEGLKSYLNDLVTETHGRYVSPFLAETTT
ncbi:hypothetical protein ABU614_07015 [Lysobacter firmicutimachus]|uniref:Uncharacterized protein n=1 Tax=Lysobacter firmicutimachus TaxID=1792846 RepID=A0AAU8MY21_9GAMM